LGTVTQESLQLVDRDTRRKRDDVVRIKNQVQLLQGLISKFDNNLVLLKTQGIQLTAVDKALKTIKAELDQIPAREAHRILGS